MEKLILRELHNPSAAGKATYGVLSPSDNTIYYNEKVAITSEVYSKFFERPCQFRRRMAILKITLKDEKGKSHSIWRAANTKGVKGIRNDSIGAPFDAIWELNATKAIRSNNPVEVDVSRGCWLPFFLFHPNHAARIATWIGLLSVGLSIVSIVLSIIGNCWLF
ncbi:MAG: hypothetical protein IK008_03685 [Bacteroidales bacterium]|nr:hypothetical protein [Bacteroidales bacterium]